MFNNATLLKL